MSDRPEPTGELVTRAREARGWSQAELATVLGIPPSRVSEIVQNKKAIDPELAVKLGEAFSDTTAKYWILADAAYRLSLIEEGNGDVRRRASLLEIAPVREMEKRGWVVNVSDFEDLEKQILALYEISSISEAPQLVSAMRMSSSYAEITPSQMAWCARVKQLAKLVPAAPYSDDNMPHCIASLRKLAAYTSEAKKVPDVLAKHGIRFVVVEHLPSTKIDGATLWLDDNSPVIGMSVRYDRIDNFWFTLFHELAHVKYRDKMSIDSNITGTDEVELHVKPEFERRADKHASDSLVAPDELLSFIHRIGPLYSEAKINQFANRMKIHPGIIVGQLHARHEFTSGYRAFRGLLTKVRDIVTSSALTDGWGKTIQLKAE